VIEVLELEEAISLLTVHEPSGRTAWFKISGRPRYEIFLGEDERGDPMSKVAFNLKRNQSSGKWGKKLPGGKNEGFQGRHDSGPQRSVNERQGNRAEMGVGNTGIDAITQAKRLEEPLKTSETRLRQASQIILAHERERKRLSEELQDSIFSKLSLIKSALEERTTLLGEESPAERFELEKLKSIAQRAMEEIRRITTNLYPAILGDLGVLGGVNYLLGEFQKLYSRVHISKEIRLQESDIPNHLGIVIFRVLQEALNNFIKHGRGDQIYAGLKKKGGEIKLLIEDNGVGFTPESSGSSLGLEGMKGRVELSGGVFKIESAKGKGTTIRASWPY
jgi:signal transduction histidine kinase